MPAPARVPLLSDRPSPDCEPVIASKPSPNREPGGGHSVPCRRDRSGGSALATVLGVGEDAADPPVRRIAGPSLVGTPVLDSGKFRRRAELAPADAVVTVVDELHLSKDFGLIAKIPGQPVERRSIR